jgi:hypothetical protein
MVGTIVVQQTMTGLAKFGTGVTAALAVSRSALRYS